MREYRNGAVGALADEYQRAVDDLLGILNRLSAEEYGVIRDRKQRAMHADRWSDC